MSAREPGDLRERLIDVMWYQPTPSKESDIRIVDGILAAIVEAGYQVVATDRLERLSVGMSNIRRAYDRAAGVLEPPLTEGQLLNVVLEIVDGLEPGDLGAVGEGE